jgi:RNA polymerase sigma-70 factor (ECF subfamily)
MDDQPLLQWIRLHATAAGGGLSDNDLWLAFRDRSDETVVRVLIDRVGGLVFARCRFITGDYHLSEEAFQEAFHELALKRKAISNYRSAVAWLLQTATYKSKNIRRSVLRKRRHERPMPGDVPSSEPISRAEDFARAWAVLLELPDRYRQPLELVYQAGMTHAETAEALQMPKGTVDSNVARGLERMRRRLGVGTASVVAALAVPGVTAPASAAVVLSALAPAAGPTLGPRFAWGLAVCGSGLAVAAGYSFVARADRPQPPPPVAARRAPTRVERLRAAFDGLVSPKQIEALRELVGEGGDVTLDAVVVTDVSVDCSYRLTARPEGGVPVTGVNRFIHVPATGRTKLLIDVMGKGRFRPINPSRSLVVWTDDPITKTEIVRDSPPLVRSVAAFEALPADGDDREAFARHTAAMERAVATIAGEWRSRGDAAKRWGVSWGSTENGTGMLVSEGGRTPFAIIPDWLRLDAAGRLHADDYRQSRVVVSADRERIDFPDIDDTWVRAK